MIITRKPIIIGKNAVFGIKSNFSTIVKVDKVYVLSQNKASTVKKNVAGVEEIDDLV